MTRLLLWALTKVLLGVCHEQHPEGLSHYSREEVPTRATHRPPPRPAGGKARMQQCTTASRSYAARLHLDMPWWMQCIIPSPLSTMFKFFQRRNTWFIRSFYASRGWVRGDLHVTRMQDNSVVYSIELFVDCRGKPFKVGHLQIEDASGISYVLHQADQHVQRLRGS
jgi:hypothetical protein